jgi:hypothetical protein
MPGMATRKSAAKTMFVMRETVIGPEVELPG